MLWLISQNLSQLHTLWQRSGKVIVVIFFGYATEREYKRIPKREIFSALNICLGRDCTFAKKTVSASRGAKSCYYKNKREWKIESLKESLPIWVLCLASIIWFCCSPAEMQELQRRQGLCREAAGHSMLLYDAPNGCRTHSTASCWYVSHWSWSTAPCTGQPSFYLLTSLKEWSGTRMGCLGR